VVVVDICKIDINVHAAQYVSNVNGIPNVGTNAFNAQIKINGTTAQNNKNNTIIPNFILIPQ
jgi:hypothetical protein